MRGRVRTAGLGLLLALAGACRAPDERDLFDPDWDRAVAKEEEKSGAFELPADVEPKSGDESLLDGIPDEGPLTISIEQAVLLTLRNSRDLKVQQLNPVIAGAFESIERGVFDPELFAEGSYFREQAEETARSTGEKFDVEGSDRNLAAGVRQQFPSGTRVEGVVEQERNSSNRAPTQETARLGLTVTQSLLRGYGATVNLARVRQAVLEVDATENALRRFAEVLIAETQIAYWNFVLAGKEIGIFEESLAVSRRQLREIEERIEVGALPRTEAAVARSEVALREQGLIRARRDLEDRRLRLLRLLSPHPDGRLDLPVTATSPPDVVAQPVTDLDDRVDLALKMRPDLTEARLRLQQGTLETIVTRNGLLPRLDLFVSLTATGFGDSFGESFGNLGDDTYEATVGLRLNQFVHKRTQRGYDRLARGTREQSARAVDNLEQLVRFEVRIAANEVEGARLQIGAARTTRELQERTVDAERERFNVGASTAIIVAQAQRDLLAAQIVEVESIINYRIARIRLALADGSLLARHGVSLGTSP